ncbi:TetR/AcrR family transcriptional regulator [Myceligenerans pegani]|uniref:TetR/AcrR family transcriptional regulator n=1 Tax=Myceligenerans pegani TaxID=2776917 RepID=A0ABR9MRW2_9MICO|nr:TetR/AcrR family transcriptional regulator [Myceligenerans sp. TRM 65318]MBE1874113.1 TetR/AcrR family transcriptional regulator [Myceligenerans sp. TRM 65318]MBE3016385.1 TetR/AcrR family transcriptional regulator [Myceligenerans sp. TRM 65318]
MPKVSDAHRRARREEILAAALRAFTAKGYQRTSMADVLAESGLSTGAIYAHFAGGKRELFVAVARTTLLRRNEELVAASSGVEPPSPGEILRIVLGGVLRDGIEPRILLQLWSEATIEPEILEMVHEAIGVVRTSFRAALERWFVQHPEYAPDGPEAAAERILPVLLGLGQGFMVQHSLFDGFDAEAYLDAATAVLPS